MNRDKFSERIDTITTVIRAVITVLSAIVAVTSFIGMQSIFTDSGEMLDNMPDGSGVADGYIAVGKVFGSFGTGLIGIFLGALFLIGCFLAIVGIILYIVYLVQRNKYNKTIDFKFLKRNIYVKTIINAINIVLLTWFMIENEVYAVVAVLALLLFVLAEVAFISIWRKK